MYWILIPHILKWPKSKLKISDSVWVLLFIQPHKQHTCVTSNIKDLIWSTFTCYVNTACLCLSFTLCVVSEGKQQQSGEALSSSLFFTSFSLCKIYKSCTLLPPSLPFSPSRSLSHFHPSILPLTANLTEAGVLCLFRNGPPTVQRRAFVWVGNLCFSFILVAILTNH